MNWIEDKIRKLFSEQYQCHSLLFNGFLMRTWTTLRTVKLLVMLTV